MIGLVVGMAMQAHSWTAEWITIPLPESSMAQSRWIWTSSPEAPNPGTNGARGTFWFRRSFRVENPDPKATLRFAADNEAIVWLNGKEIGRSTDWSRLTGSNVGRELRQGDNEIVVRATNTPIAGKDNPAGLIVAVENGGALIGTDGSWECAKDQSFQDVTSVAVIGPAESTPWKLSDRTLTPPNLRREFEVRGPVKKATVRVIGLGDYELRLNGKVVGDTVLNQTWSQYDRALYWRTFDVTKELREGANAFGVTLGGSFWYIPDPGPGRYCKRDMMTLWGEKQPFILRLECDIETSDGQKFRVGTDRSWKWTPSSLIFSHIYGGEDYDARLEQPGWDRPGFGDARWQPVLRAVAPKAELRPQAWPGLKVHDRFRPTRWIEREPGRWSVDFGQNCSGMIRATLRGKPGQEIVVKPSEVMSDDGEVQQLNLWGTSAYGRYILRGAGAEDWRWKFFYHGFRYVEVKGAVPKGKPNPHGLPVIESIELLHTRTANPTAGQFKTSSDLFNRTHDLVDWAMRSNMSHVLSDCPHREKAGWLECAYLLAPTFSYRYDCHDWLRKIAADIRDAQMGDGRIGTVAPNVLQLPPENAFAYTVEWGAAGVLLPWHLYQWYGDRGALSDSYASMKRFTDHVGTLAKGNIAPAGLGDWYDYGHGQGPGPSRFTPQDLSATACWAMCVTAVASAADVLGHAEDARHYRRLHTQIREAFLAKFYDPKSKTLANNGSPQAGHAMALEANLIPEQDRAAVLEAITDDLVKRDYQQTPGDIGHLYFIRALAHGGRSDVLHRVYSRTGVGSYGGILAKLLTTLPETWDAITVGSNSLNHCMLGHVMEWFYGWVLGMRQSEGSVGWREAVIAPEPGDLTSAKGQMLTPKGTLKVQWEKTRSYFELRVDVPKGMEAQLILPQGGNVLLSGPSGALRRAKGKRGDPLRVGAGASKLRIEAASD